MATLEIEALQSDAQDSGACALFEKELQYIMDVLARFELTFTLLPGDVDVGWLVYVGTFGVPPDSRLHPFPISLSSFDPVVSNVVV